MRYHIGKILRPRALPRPPTAVQKTPEVAEWEFLAGVSSEATSSFVVPWSRYCETLKIRRILCCSHLLFCLLIPTWDCRFHCPQNAFTLPMLTQVSNSVCNLLPFWTDTISVIDWPLRRSHRYPRLSRSGYSDSSMSLVQNYCIGNTIALKRQLNSISSRSGTSLCVLNDHLNSRQDA